MRAARVPTGIRALAAFFLFGAAMAALAGLGLLLPGGALEPMWRLNPRSRESLVSLGVAGVALMLLVSAACGAAAWGLGALSPWGRRLALGILAVSALGDAANALFRHDLRTLLGLPVAGLMIAYLLHPRVGAQFRAGR